MKYGVTNDFKETSIVYQLDNFNSIVDALEELAVARGVLHAEVRVRIASTILPTEIAESTSTHALHRVAAGVLIDEHTALRAFNTTDVPQTRAKLCLRLTLLLHALGAPLLAGEAGMRRPAGPTHDLAAHGTRALDLGPLEEPEAIDGRARAIFVRLAREERTQRALGRGRRLDGEESHDGLDLTDKQRGAAVHRTENWENVVTHGVSHHHFCTGLDADPVSARKAKSALSGILTPATGTLMLRLRITRDGILLSLSACGFDLRKETIGCCNDSCGGPR
jgi:hypothetical protein